MRVSGLAIGVVLAFAPAALAQTSPASARPGASQPQIQQQAQQALAALGNLDSRTVAELQALAARPDGVNASDLQALSPGERNALADIMESFSDMAGVDVSAVTMTNRATGEVLTGQAALDAMRREINALRSGAPGSASAATPARLGGGSLQASAAAASSSAVAAPTAPGAEPASSNLRAQMAPITASTPAPVRPDLPAGAALQPDAPRMAVDAAASASFVRGRFGQSGEAPAGADVRAAAAQARDAASQARDAAAQARDNAAQVRDAVRAGRFGRVG